MNGSAYAAGANMRPAPSKQAATNLKVNNRINVFLLYLLFESFALVRSVTPRIWARITTSSACTRAIAGPRTRRENSEELAPRARTIVKLTDSVPRFAAIVAGGAIDIVDSPSAIVAGFA